MTEREEEILRIIEEDPLISQYELADELGITRSGVAAHIHNLMRKGYIKGRGYVLNEPKFVTVIGGINMDILGISNEKLIDNNSNPGKISHSLGGAGRNIALTLTKLEIPNYFISVYGDDMNGDKFLDDAKENDMNIQCCERINNAHTSSFLYIDDANGNKTIGIGDMDIYQSITPVFLDKYIERINHSEYCIIDTNLPKETIEYLYEKTHVPLIAKTVSLNKNGRLINGIEKINTLITTPNELLQILAEYQQKYDDIQQATCFLLEKGVQNIVVLSVNDGLYFKNQQEELQINRPQQAQINTNGASAVLTGAIIWGLKNKMAWTQILQYAYTAAMITIETKEAVHPLLSMNRLMEREVVLFQTEK